jgi:hypothetical protein
MEGGLLPPEEMAESARRMMEARDEERPEISTESALQLREALRDVHACEAALESTEAIAELPLRARAYVESHERLRASMGAAANEAMVPEVERRPRSVMVTTRG